MSLLHVFILSAVEGITEFLPISSTGHMILASKLLGIVETDFVKTFEIVIQLGAILAVVVLYFKKFFKSFDLYKKLFVAFVPTAIVGFFLYPFIKGYLLGSSQVVVWSLFLGGIAIILFEKYHKPTVHRSLTTVHYLIIGLFQSLSVIPGVSRAAATIIGGLTLGLSRESATEFSFLLAVPTMMAASALDIYKSRSILMSGNLSMLLIGTLLSFIFAAIAVKFLIGYVKKHNFIAFGVYRIVLALLFWMFMK
ncbi:MAG: undecaprenyl-diphosphatase UppP [Candidatus Woesebacteria bacterium]|nr:undecaprenyl-diphosphatase UppP [Candidatus Woesebacteria bacterium]